MQESAFDPWILNDDLSRKAELAAAEIRSMRIPNDRSVALRIKERVCQDWVDDAVLRAHLVAPVWSDFALVETRPSIWQLAASVPLCTDDSMVLVADDSLVIASGDSVQLLISISAVPVENQVRYQLSLHCLTMNIDSLILCHTFREIADRFGLIDFVDAALIDRCGLTKTGRGAEEYIVSPERRRPVFLFPRLSRLSTRAKEYHRATQAAYSGVGPVVVNDQLYRRYSHLLTDRKFGCVAILPEGEALAVERAPDGQPRDFFLMLERCPLLTEVGHTPNARSLGQDAQRAWLGHTQRLPALAALYEAGEVFRERWEALMVALVEEAKLASRPEIVEQEPASPPRPQHPPRKIMVDDAGYPLNASDIVSWAERRFSSSIVFLSRAKRAMTKVGHPEPARIAKAIEALACFKIACLRGNRESVDEFNRALLELRMRDGFSNADRLKGQTGAAYLVEHNGRRMLLERHLCSLSSGFNDAKMIRIYYVFDRHADRILVGWLPSHLPTSQS